MVAVRVQRLVERLGEDVVGEGDVVVRTPDAHGLVDGPAERAVVHHYVAHRLGNCAFDLECVAVRRIGADPVVAHAYAQVLDQDVRRLDLDGCAANQDAWRWRRLACDGEVVVADREIRREFDRARHFEHTDTRRGCVHASLQGADATRVDIGHLVYRATTTGRCVHAESSSSRDDGYSMGSGSGENCSSGEGGPDRAAGHL
jgi:hypothetical protein